MFRRMFHKQIDYFKERIHTLFLYLIKNELILFCLVYVLGNFLILQWLRNIPDRVVIGYLVVSFVVFVILGMKKQSKEEENETSVKKSDRVKNRYSLMTKIKIYQILVLAMLIVILRVFCFLKIEKRSISILEGFMDDFACVYVKIDEEPDQGEISTTYHSVLLSDNLFEYPFSEVGILFRYSNYLSIDLGDVYEICGTISEPENFDDFDYKKFLMNKNIYGIFDVSSLKKVGRKISIYSVLYDFKQILIEKLEKSMTEPQISLLIGILFGEDRYFDGEFEEYLRKSGTSHIVAASGYNVTILVIAVNKVFRFLKKKWRNILSLVIIWTFCIISGGSASIVRATIMGSLVLIASSLGRYQSIHRTMIIGISLFIFFSPVVIFNVGFQLSICATFGLIYFAPSLENILEKRFKMGEFFKEYLLTTISCTLCTLPVSISTFGTFSIIGVLANILILPVLESTMLWGLLGLISSFLSKGISRIFLTVTFTQLKYFEYVVSSLGRLEFSSFNIDGLAGAILSVSVLIILVLFIIIICPIENEGFNYYFRLMRKEDD